MSIEIRRDVSSYELSQYGNCPIELLKNQPITQAASDGNTIFTIDANPCVVKHDPSGLDTPNFSRRTCNEYDIMHELMEANKLKRLQADQILEYKLGQVASSNYQLEETALKYSWACVLGLAQVSQLDFIPRVRDRNANPRIRTHISFLDGTKTGFDSDFHKRSRRLRPRFKRNDTHPDLLDSSWIGSPSRHPSEVQTHV